MRLPSVMMSSSQEQGSAAGMSPLEMNRNGHLEDGGGNQEENSVATNGESSSVAPTSTAARAAPPSGGQSGVLPDDFSEYLWMENEEEFDSETLKQIEEDYMISHYSDMFENSLLEDGQPGPTTASLCVVSGSFLPPSFSDPHNHPTTNPQDDVDDVTRRFNRSMNFASRLNPDAAEFVPKAPSSNNVTANH